VEDDLTGPGNDSILHALGASSKETLMTFALRTPDLALRAGEVLTLDDAQGVRIASRLGFVWVTEEGDGKDHIVGPGDAIVLRRGGRALVQALQAASISIGDGPANDERAD
jgi:hypothetical protein